MKTIAWMTGLWLAASSCTLEPVLAPGVGAAIASGTETVVFVEAQGVRAWVDGAAWRGEPSSCGWPMRAPARCSGSSTRRSRFGATDPKAYFGWTSSAVPSAFTTRVSAPLITSV